MIVFLNQGHHLYTHRVLAGRPELGKVQCRSYDWLFRRSRPPRGTYVFTDRERLDPWELRAVSARYVQLAAQPERYRVINDPARMMRRTGLLRALHEAGINDFNAYPVTERVWPERYPVFIRREFDHKAPLTDLLRDRAALEAALVRLRAEREPEEGLLIIEYCGAPVRGELFRKLSAYRVAERVFFFNTGHERSWLVKYGEQNAATDALYKEEGGMIEANAYSDVLRRAFEIAGVEYGRADFGLVEDRVQVYEINTNPLAVPPGDHPNAIRRTNQQMGWNRYCAALNAIDHEPPHDSISTTTKKWHKVQQKAHAARTRWHEKMCGPFSPYNRN